MIGVMTGLLMALFGIGGGAFIVPALDAAFLAVPNSTYPPFQLIVIGSLCTIVIGSLPRAIKVLIGLWTLFGKNPSSKSVTPPVKPSTYKLVTVGAISGISSALFGLGGATLLMPLLTMWVGLPIAICVDISILFVSATSIVSLTTLISAWVGIHGADSIDSTMLILILILGVSAALTQTLAAGKLVRMKDGLRQRLLGCYLVSLGIWVIARSLS